jgi:hypothetical protein
MAYHYMMTLLDQAVFIRQVMKHGLVTPVLPAAPNLDEGLTV